MPDERMNGMEWNGLSPRGGVGFWEFESWVDGWLFLASLVERGRRGGDEVK